MDERIEKYLYDIKIAIDEIELFLQQLSLINFNEYKQNHLPKLKQQVETLLNHKS